jgi:hypothetical protein
MWNQKLFTLWIAVTLSSPVAVLGDWRTDVGYDAFQSEFGASLADGTDITVMMVEADGGGGNYKPDPSLPQFANQAFVDKSGGSGVSGHANFVGNVFFGTNSLAPKVRTVHTWFTDGESGYFYDYLNPINNTGSEAPATDTARVQNHSYVGVNTGNPNTDLTPAEVTDLTLRFDYAIQRDGFVGVVALNNGSNTLVPELFGNNYNGITVGLTVGAHSRGGTTGLAFGTTNTSGRIKPDIVAPATVTSESTPMISSAATVLLSYADAHTVTHANARFNSEVIKAQLLAGATKDEFSSWQRTTTQPLDIVYGAGELNLYNSYHIMAAGEQDGAPATSLVPAVVTNRGWDFATTTVVPMLYFFDVPTGQSLDDLSVVLTWNTVQAQLGTVVIPDLSLELFSVTDLSTLGTPLDASDSALDNVEHIYVPGLLGPGRYALRVQGDEGFDYALAWTATAVPEPSMATLVVLAAMPLLIRRRTTRPI